MCVYLQLYNIYFVRHYLICWHIAEYASINVNIMLEVLICILHFSRCLYRCIDKHIHSAEHLVTSVLSHETEVWSQLRMDQLEWFSC